MTKTKALLLGCGSALLMVVILIGLIVGWFVHVSKDVEGIAVSIDSPLNVKVGETFTLKVNIKNEREKSTLKVSDIDIGKDYLDGFVVVSTEPTPKSSMTVPLDDSLSYTFNTAIPAQSTKAFSFTLRAERAGIFRGDVDVCEGQRFITTIAQTVVNE
jgi:BatD DUF11 like domain